MRSFYFLLAVTPVLAFAESEDSSERLQQELRNKHIISNQTVEHLQPRRPQQQKPRIAQTEPQTTIVNTDPAIKELQNKVSLLQQQVNNMQEKQNGKTFLSPGRPQVAHGWNVFLTGDFLYWRANVNEIPYALKAPIHDQASFYPVGGTLKNPDFEWNYGFRIGAGWNTCHDDWDLFAEWTRIHLSAHGHDKSSGTKFLFPTYADSIMGAAPVTTAKEHWHLHLNIIDLELGRECYLGKAFTLRPHAGIRTAWIDQHFNFDYKGQLTIDPSSFNDVKYHNDFWGMGLRGGIDSQWELAWGISIFGDFAISLLYGNFSINRENKLSALFLGTQFAFDKTNHDSFHLARAIADLAMGLRWDYMFLKERYHIGLQAGWEEHIFWGQNQLYNFMDTIALFNHGKTAFNNGDLTTQGLTVSVRLDF